MSTTIDTHYTAEDLLTMPDGELYELADGQLVELQMGIESSWISGRLLFLLSRCVEERQLGWVFPADNSFQCFPKHPNRVRKPDVSFIRAGRLPNEELPRGHCQIAPDLVAEVVSPNDLYSEVVRKVFEYLEVGVPLVWVIEPDSRTVMVYQPGSQPALLCGQDELAGVPVLDGFSCKIQELFPPKLRPGNAN